MSQLSDIRAIFAQALSAHQSAGVAYENVPLEPVPDSWLRFTFFQDSIDQAEYGRYGRNQRTGTVQVSIFEPLHIGIGKALDKAGEIETLFPRGFSDSYNGVTARVMRTEIEHQLSDDRYFHIPVSIYWLAYTAPL